MEKIFLNECKFDDSGAVIEPMLHDSNLIKLEFCDEKNIKLSFKLTSNEVKTIHLIGVEGFVCNGMRKGNIVLDLTVSSGNSASICSLTDLFEVPKYEKKNHEVFLNKIENKIYNKELSILVLNPSYGCKLLALIHSIGFE